MLCSFFIISENVNCSGASVEGTSLEREQLASWTSIELDTNAATSGSTELSV